MKGLSQERGGDVMQGARNYTVFGRTPLKNTWWIPKFRFRRKSGKMIDGDETCLYPSSIHEFRGKHSLSASFSFRNTSSHYKVLVHWMPRPFVPKQWDLGQKLRCLWKAWSMVFHALKVVEWALMTPSGHKLTKCKKCQVVTHKKLQKLTISCPELAPRFLGAN